MYNEKIQTQLRKHKIEITECEANMEPTMRKMHQEMEDDEEHGNKLQKGVDGLRADFKEYSED